MSSKGNIGTIKNIIIAALAGVFNVLVTNPLWMITTQLTLTKESFMECCKRVLKDHGWSGFYAGVGSSLMLVSNPIIQFVCYEQLSRIARKIMELKPQKRLVSDF